MLIGVVGKANVGKSTFFKAATLAEAEIAINNAIITLGAEAKEGDEKAIKAISDIGILSSKSSFSTPTSNAIKELEVIQNTLGIDDGIKTKAKQAIVSVKQVHTL